MQYLSINVLPNFALKIFHHNLTFGKSVIGAILRANVGDIFAANVGDSLCVDATVGVNIDEIVDACL